MKVYILLISLSIIIYIILLVMFLFLTSRGEVENLNDLFFEQSNYFLNIFNGPIQDNIARSYKIKYDNPRLYNLLLNKNSSVLIIGNGDINFGKKTPDDIKTFIDSHDIIVRINNWEKDSRVDYLGDRCDLCFIVEPIALSNKLNDEITYIYCSCDFLRYKSYMFDHNVHILKEDVFDNICKANPSRGMIAILAFYNYYNNVSIIGFKGVGHATDKAAPNAHNITTHERVAMDKILSKKIKTVIF